MPIRLILMAGAILALAGGARAGTLEDVLEAGVLRCGVAEDRPGFSENAGNGRWQGFDVDYCRAVAAAVVGDGDAVAFVPLSDRDRFAALAERRIDLLSRHAALTMSREVGLGVVAAATNFHDGQAVMVRADHGVTSAIELSGSAICVQAGTLLEVDLAAYFERRKMTYDPVVLDDEAAVLEAYDAGRCSSVTGERTRLHALRAGFDDPRSHAILPETIQRKPVALMVRHGDEAWRDVVKWIHHALVAAEELGLTADLPGEPVAVDARNLLGLEGTFGEALGLDKRWAARAVEAVGNYGDIYARHLGADSSFDMPRGLNALWRDGGLMAPPPIR